MALGDESDCTLPPSINWVEVTNLAFAQGVSSIVVDGLQKCLEFNDGSLELLLDSEKLGDLKYELLGQVLQDENDFRAREKTTRKLASMWAAEGIDTVILKGTSFAQYYPVASHRYSCDLDLFIGEDWKMGCHVLEAKGFDICYEVYKDAQFHIDGVYVECHRYLMPIRGNRTLQRFERYLRLLLKGKMQVGNDSLFAPPLMFNALFCIEHARGHLLHERLTLRQVCDWMLLRRQPVDWDEFWKRCDEFGFTRFAKMFDSLADLVEGKVRYEDLPSVNRRVADAMLTDDDVPVGKQVSFLKRRVRLFFDIVGNGWKYREFNDVSMPVALMRQVWTHFFGREVKV